MIAISTAGHVPRVQAVHKDVMRCSREDDRMDKWQRTPLERVLDRGCDARKGIIDLDGVEVWQ